MQKNKDDGLRPIVESSLESIGVDIRNLQAQLGHIDDVRLLVELEKIWPKITNLKTFSNFIKEDLQLATKERSLVILVEDSESLQFLMCDLITSIKSHDVICTAASTYNEGIELIRHYMELGIVDLIVTDLILSKGGLDAIAKGQNSGIGIAKEVGRLNARYSSDVPCIMVTSYRRHDLLDEARKFVSSLVMRADVPTILSDMIIKVIEGTI